MIEQTEAIENKEEKKFHGWKLLGFILLVVVVLALISAAVDLFVLSSLE